jgi:glycosyltransferase 2 family protein
LTSVLPVKGIGGFGTWESAWALTLRLMHFSPNLAVISGIGVHLITNFFEYFLGIISLLILYFPLRNQRK